MSRRHEIEESLDALTLARPGRRCVWTVDRIKLKGILGPYGWKIIRCGRKAAWTFGDGLMDVCAEHGPAAYAFHVDQALQRARSA